MKSLCLLDVCYWYWNFCTWDMFLNHWSIMNSGMSASRLKEFIFHLFHASLYLSSLIWSITQVMSGHQHKMLCFLLCTFLHLPVTSFLLILHKILQSCSLSTYSLSILPLSTFTVVTVSHNLQAQFSSNTWKFVFFAIPFICLLQRPVYICNLH
jgi:hypothetical protein